MDPQQELALFRFLTDLGTHLETVREIEKALRIALRLTRDFFKTDAACVAVRASGGAVAVDFNLPSGTAWDEQLLADYLAGERPKMRYDTLLVPLVRRGRTWGVLAIRRDGSDFDRGALGAMRKVGQVVSRILQRIDTIRIAEVASRIDRKMMEQLRPKDLFYQILHGLRSLTGYDHSAGLFTHEKPGTLELVAEQIAWKKAKSVRIGDQLELTPEVRKLLESDECFGFDKADRWKEWNGRPVTALAQLLDYHGDVRGRALLCAPLATRDGLLGLLEVTSVDPGSFGPHEAELLRRFVPRAAVALRNLQRTESLEIGMLEAEKKHAMANLARGVSHDINNAFGAVLPLVQQMVTDVQEGELDRDVLLQDLGQIESSVQVCRRIFGGMLSFSRGVSHGLGEGDVRRAVESTLAILDESMKRLGIRVTCELPDSLPAVQGRQGDLEQLVLNVMTNARDAMPEGGEMRIAGRERDGRIELSVTDTGAGIDPELLPRIQEPFFTTKEEGNGLGLSICRSIVWNMRGEIRFTGPQEGGTRVTLELPLAEERELI